MIEVCEFCGYATWLPCYTQPAANICKAYHERQLTLLDATLARVANALNETWQHQPATALNEEDDG